MVTKRLFLFALIAIALAAFAIACGGGDDDSDSGDTGSSSSRDRSTDGDSSDSDDHDGPATDVTKINVCDLLSEADVKDVSEQFKFGGGTEDGAVYKLTATREEYDAESQKIRARSGCRFEIDAGGAFGVVVFEITEADGWDLYEGQGEKIPDLGDDAVMVTGSPLMKVGDVMVSIGEDSLSSDFDVELMRKMAPKLDDAVK